MSNTFRKHLGIFSALVLGCLSLSAAETKPAPVFDAANKTFKFGPKEMVFADNGTFKVMSSGRCIATGSFFMSTAFRPSQNNSAAKVNPGPYKDGPIYVESCKADPATKTVTVEGKLPFHKPGTPVQLGSWKQTAALTADGKVDIVLDFELPEGQSPNRVKGFTLTFPTATGFTYGKKPVFRAFDAEKVISPYTGPAILPKYADEKDSIAWEFPETKIRYIFNHRPGRNTIYFTPHTQYKTCRFHVRFNPM